MKEGFNRRELLRGALAAALAGTSTETAYAKQSQEMRNPEIERASEAQHMLDELRTKAEELRDAYQHKDTNPERYERVKKEMDELFEKAKPLMENLQK